jgi:hypothetical protein
MIGIYCHAQHGTSDALCGECDRLLAYAIGRLERCPFAAEKPSCAHCPVHCHKPAMRRRIKDVMRYAGPRMLYRHPILAMLHLCGKQRGDKRKIGSDRWDNRDYRYFNGE